MIFLILRATLLATVAFMTAAAAATTPDQELRVQTGLVQIDIGADCDLTACADVTALIDSGADEQDQDKALYQDLLTPVEDRQPGTGQYARKTSDTALLPAQAASVIAVTPVPEEQPYTMLLIGLGLLAFSSRKKPPEKFII